MTESHGRLAAPEPPARQAEPATIALPAEIDMANSASVQAILAAAIASRPAIVLADLTTTTFTDSSAIRVLWKAHRDAAVHGIHLRLVTTEPGVLRVLELTGLGQQLPSGKPAAPGRWKSTWPTARIPHAWAAPAG